MHNRDLYILRNILKANAVRLASWDPLQNHSHFLQLCKQYGLPLGLKVFILECLRYVIPTFDLSYFLSASVRMPLRLRVKLEVSCARIAPFRTRQREVWEGFQKFMQQVGFGCYSELP